MDLDKGAGLNLDISRIPEELHWLVPLVERWGWESLDDQDEYVSMMEKERSHEVKEFSEAMDRSSDDIRRWGASLSITQKHMTEMTESDWRHPYWSFLSAIKIREITGYNEISFEEIEMKNELSKEIRMERYQEATIKADVSFREGRYSEYIEMLFPFLDLLSSTQQKKMKLAEKKKT